MANEQSINEIISPEAFGQIDKLKKDLQAAASSFVKAASEANKFNQAVGKSGLKDFTAANAKAAKAVEDLRQAELKTQAIIEKIDRAREASMRKEQERQAKQDAIEAKKIAQDEARAKRIAMIEAAEMAAAKKQEAANKQAVAEAQRLQKEFDQLTSKAYAMTGAYNNNTSATKSNSLSKQQLAQMIAEEKYRQQQATAELKNNAREMLNAKGSLEQRRAALIRLTTVYDRLSEAERKTAFGERLGKTIRDLSKQIGELELATNRGQRNVGQYSSSFDQLTKSLEQAAVAYFSLNALIKAGESIIHTNAEVSDGFTNVQRTAKLGAREVDGLVEKLKGVKTRTDLEGLLDIGFIGGRLGVAKEELFGFITTVDQLAVVLKKEFPGGAEAISDALGRVVAVYKITEREGISLGQALTNTGSAFLELAHNGMVNVQYLQDFALRTAGVAQVAKLSLPTMLAYGAVLAQTGIGAQVAGTSVTRLISSLSTKRDKYFAIAQLADSNLTLKEFTRLINTDTKAALDLFFKGLKAGNPSQTQFADRLNSLKFTTGAAKNAIIALAENQDMLAKKVKLANEANKDGTSVAHNYELANNSLAASFDKIKNAITNIFINSETSRRLAGFLNSLTSTKTEAAKLAEEFVNNKHKAEELNEALDPLVARYDQLKKKGKLNTEEQKELRDITAKIGRLLPDVTTKFDDYGNAIDINRRKITELTAAQRKYLELQNRQAIKAANEQFDKAQKQIPEAQKNALRLAKATSTFSDRVYDFLYGGDSLADKKQAGLDRLTRLSGRSYEAAKIVRDLGGTLTAAQKKVLDYYETLNNKPKKDATIVSDNDDTLAEGPSEKTLKLARRNSSALLEIQIQNIKKSQDNYKAIAENEEYSLNGRLEANEKFEELGYQLVELNGKKKIVSQKRTANEIKAIEAGVETDKQKVAKDSLDFQNKLFKDSQKKLENSFKEQIASLNEKQRKEIELVRSGVNEKLEAIEQEHNKSSQIAENAYAEGKITKKNYEEEILSIDRKAAYDRVQVQIDVIKDVINLEREALKFGLGSSKDLAADEKKLADLEISLSRLKTKAKLSDLDKLAEKRKRIADEQRKLEEAAFEFVQTMVLRGFENKINSLNAESEAVQEKKDRDIEAINESTASEQEKADKIAIINSQADAKQAIIEKRIKSEKIKQAKAEKAFALLQIAYNTSVAVSKAVAESPLTFGMPWTAYAIALGAIQAASVLARPIPKYKDGTGPGGHPFDGLAMVGDGYKHELRIEPDGTTSITPNRPTITHMKKGTHIIGGDQLELIKRKSLLPRISQKDNRNSLELSAVVEGLKSVKSAIVKQKQFGSIITAKGVRGYMASQKNVNDWLTRNGIRRK